MVLLVGLVEEARDQTDRRQGIVGGCLSLLCNYLFKELKRGCMNGERERDRERRFWWMASRLKLYIKEQA